MAARTRNGSLVRSRLRELQQLGECCGSGVMHGRAHRHLDGFQIETACLATAIENDADQLIYLERDFLADGFGRFFSCEVRVSSMGRKRQTCSLTSTRSRLNCW